MKNSHSLSNEFQGTLAAIAVVGLVLAAPVHAQRSPEGKSSSKIEGLEKVERIDLQKMDLMSYRATGESALSEDEVYQHAEELAHATGSAVDVKPAEFQDDVFTFFGREDQSTLLDINARTGEVSFSGGFARYREEGSTPGLPARKLAPELALDWVASVGMLPNESEIVVGHIGGLNMSARQEDGTTADYEKLVTVHFGRKLDGLPVLGASRLVVHLAEHGRMQGLVRSWVAVKGERVDAGAVLGSDAVLDAAIKALVETSTDATSIEVETAEVILFDDGEGIIEPAVHVTATRRYADIRLGEQPLDFYIPALVEANGAFPSIKSRNLPDK